MSVNLTINGAAQILAETGDADWGTYMHNTINACSQALQRSGGEFTLRDDLNLGSSYGVEAKHFTSSSDAPATQGTVRLAYNDEISWLNEAGTRTNTLGHNTSSNTVTWNGGSLLGASGVFTPNSAVAVNTNGLLISTTTNRADLEFIHGLTSDVQTQFTAINAVQDTQDLRITEAFTSPLNIQNINIEHFTDTDTFDSIRITGSGLADLSSTNKGHVIVPVTHGGYTTTFSITEDVEMLLTGATWGLDANVSEVVLYVYAIHDNNDSIVWGISDEPDKRVQAYAPSSADPSNITVSGYMLTSSVLTASGAASWPCVQIGWRKFKYVKSNGGTNTPKWWQGLAVSGSDSNGMGTPATDPNKRILARYTNNISGSGDVIQDDTPTRLCFETFVYDTPGINTVSYTNFAGDDWVFTAPTSGYYEVTSSIRLDDINASNNDWVYLLLYRDTSLYSVLNWCPFNYADNPATVGLQGSDTLYLNLGQTIHLKVTQNTNSTAAMKNGSQYNFINIKKV